MSVRVRFAPSPTGFLHVGGARTALFNYLFARRHGGTYVLRVEDTDAARERPEYREEIFRALRWLGLDHDEGPDVGGAYGPYNQSERMDRYRAALDELVARHHVYPCFCASRAGDVAQDDELLQKSAPCACSLLSAEEVATRRAAAKETPALRFRVDAARTYRVVDLVRGDVEFPPGEVEDFIVAKAGGAPLYNFAAVVDDAAMRITHVIRGEEHLANTPKQIALYEALGKPIPQFAHLPILLNTDRKTLSKRDGATGVSEYRAAGFLPDALVNFLSLLGWSPPGGDREIFSRAELCELFDLDRVQKHGAVFDVVKLTWMNGEYIRTAPLETNVRVASELLAAQPDAASLRTDRQHVAACCEPKRASACAKPRALCRTFPGSAMRSKRRFASWPSETRKSPENTSAQFALRLPASRFPPGFSRRPRFSDVTSRWGASRRSCGFMAKWCGHERRRGQRQLGNRARGREGRSHEERRAEGHARDLRAPDDLVGVPRAAGRGRLARDRRDEPGKRCIRAGRRGEDRGDGYRHRHPGEPVRYGTCDADRARRAAAARRHDSDRIRRHARRDRSVIPLRDRGMRHPDRARAGDRENAAAFELWARHPRRRIGAARRRSARLHAGRARNQRDECRDLRLR